MRAVDTNIIVRLLTADDPEQTKIAIKAMEAGEVFLGTSVILETEWVLRSGYGLAPANIAKSLRSLLGLPTAAIEEPEAIALALDWTEQGMDFADALHIARPGNCSAFLSFDRKLAKRARGVTTIPVEVP